MHNDSSRPVSDLCSRLDLLAMCVASFSESDAPQYLDELLDYHYDRFVGFCENVRGQNPTSVEITLHDEWSSFLTRYADGSEVAYYRRDPLNTDLID